MSLEPVARTRKADLVNQILRAAGVEVEDAPGAHAGASAASEATTANGADAGSAAQAGETSSKPTRGRTSRARSATKTDVSEPVEAGSNGSAGESGPGRSGDGPHSYDSAVVNGNSPAGSPGAEVENAVAEAAAAILASSDSERISRETGTSASSDEPGAGPSGAASNGGSDQTQADISANSRSPRQPQQHSQPGRSPQGGQGGQVGQVEPGNRRGRRRRGRDRERGAQEPQGGGQEVAWQGELVPVRGLLDLRDEGYGFLRTSGYLPSAKDVYVSVSQARRFCPAREVTPSRAPAGRQARARSTPLSCGSTRSAG